jgi:hypothetical protein
MTSMVLTLLGSWLMTATVVGLLLGRMISAHHADHPETPSGANRSTRAA